MIIPPITGCRNHVEQVVYAIKSHIVRVRRIRRNPEDPNVFAEVTPDEIRALDNELAEKKRQHDDLGM